MRTLNGFGIIIGVALWTCIVTTTLLASFSLSPVSLSHNTSRKIMSLVPQGWGFFTRDPREDDRNAYQVIDNKLVSIHAPSLSIKGRFGISRKQRAIFSEIGQLIGQVPDSCWVDYKGELNQLPSLSFKVPTLKDNISFKSIKGPVFLVKKEVIPWAWAKTINNNKIKRAYKVAKVNVI